MKKDKAPADSLEPKVAGDRATGDGVPLLGTPAEVEANDAATLVEQRALFRELADQIEKGILTEDEDLRWIMADIIRQHADRMTVQSRPPGRPQKMLADTVAFAAHIAILRGQSRDETFAQLAEANGVDLDTVRKTYDQRRESLASFATWSVAKKDSQSPSD